MKYLKTYWGKVILGVMVFLTCILCSLWIHNNNNNNYSDSHKQESTQPVQSVPAVFSPAVVSSKGTVSVTKSAVPTVTVQETMSATVGNRKVTVPLQEVHKELSEDSVNYSTTYTNDIDVSKFVEPLVPKWEVGVGIGRHSDNTYIPVSVQRNYKTDKAVRVEVHLDTDKSLRPNGVEVMHVWKW